MLADRGAFKSVDARFDRHAVGHPDLACGGFQQQLVDLAAHNLKHRRWQVDDDLCARDFNSGRRGDFRIAGIIGNIDAGIAADFRIVAGGLCFVRGGSFKRHGWLLYMGCNGYALRTGPIPRGHPPDLPGLVRGAGTGIAVSGADPVLAADWDCRDIAGRKEDAVVLDVSERPYGPDAHEQRGLWAICGLIT